MTNTTGVDVKKLPRLNYRTEDERSGPPGKEAAVRDEAAQLGKLRPQRVWMELLPVGTL